MKFYHGAMTMTDNLNCRKGHPHHFTYSSFVAYLVQESENTNPPCPTFSFPIEISFQIRKSHPSRLSSNFSLSMELFYPLTLHETPWETECPQISSQIYTKLNLA